MRIDRLVAMANDIAAFFASEPDEVAAARGVAAHLERFWDPRMRQQIIAHHRHGGAGLTVVALAGVRRLAETSASQNPTR